MQRPEMTGLQWYYGSSGVEQGSVEVLEERAWEQIRLKRKATEALSCGTGS